MKRVLSVLILAVSVAAPASAAPMSFFAFLNGANEAPTNASPGTGVTVVTIDPTAHTMRVAGQLQRPHRPATPPHTSTSSTGLATPTRRTRSGPVATTTPTFTGFPTGVTSGVYFATLRHDPRSPTYRARLHHGLGGTRLRPPRRHCSRASCEDTGVPEHPHRREPRRRDPRLPRRVWRRRNPGVPHGARAGVPHARRPGACRPGHASSRRAELDRWTRRKARSPRGGRAFRVSLR